MIINKENIIEGIKTCSKLRNAWHNGNYPSSSYSTDVKKIEDLLSELLIVDKKAICDCDCNKEKKCNKK